MYFDDILFSPLTLPRSSPLPYPPNFQPPSLSKDNIQWKTKLKTNKQKLNKTKNNKKAPQKHGVWFVSADNSWTWALPWVCLINSVRLHKRKKFFSQQASIMTSFMVRGGTFCPLPLLSTGILSDLNLYKACVCCRSLCVFIPASALLCLEDFVSLESYTTSGS